jgi:hypothetical protein
LNFCYLKEEPEHALAKFVETAALREALPVFDRRILDSAPSSIIDFSDIDADRKLYTKRMAEEWNEEIGGNSRALAKMETREIDAERVFASGYKANLQSENQRAI